MRLGTRIQLLLGIIIITGSCSDGVEAITPEKASTEDLRETDTTARRISSKIIFTDSVGWGYQIYQGSKLMIDQPHIPSVPTNKGFKSREAAQLTANFILYKLSQEIFPPRITPKEMDSLGVINLDEFPQLERD